MKKKIRFYLKHIKRNLPCCNKLMRKMLGDLKMDIEAYIEENNAVDFEQVEQHFGAAENIAKEFTVGIDSAYVKSYKLKRNIIIAGILVLTMIFAAILIFTIYTIIDAKKNQPITHDTNITYEYKKEWDE